MRIETTDRLWFQGYKDQTEFQKEVIRILLCDDKFLVFYIGRCEDLQWKYKYYLFGARWKNGKVKISTPELKEKWNGLMMLTGQPTWCIVMWKRENCKFIPRKVKLKKDGTPRVQNYWSRKKKAE